MAACGPFLHHYPYPFHTGNDKQGMNTDWYLHSRIYDRGNVQQAMATSIIRVL